MVDFILKPIYYVKFENIDDACSIVHTAYHDQARFYKTVRVDRKLI